MRHAAVGLLVLVTVLLFQNEIEAQTPNVNLSLNLHYNQPADPSLGGKWYLMAKTTSTFGGIAQINAYLSNIDAFGVKYGNGGVVGNGYNVSVTAATLGAQLNNGQPYVGAFGDITNVVYFQNTATGPIVQGVGRGEFIAAPGEISVDPLGNPAWNGASLIASGTFGAQRPEFVSYLGHPTSALCLPLGGTTPPLNFAVAANTIASVRSAGLPGDYNRNLVVDAADYVVWRKTLGTSGVDLPADGNGNFSIDAGDYNVWRQNYGAGGGAGSGFLEMGTQAVPEPSSWNLACWILAAGFCKRRARATRPLLRRAHSLRALIQAAAFVAIVVVAGNTAPWANAAPTMDGTADAEYGPALSIQNTNSQFGSAFSGDPINGGGGSEIDQVFARVANGRLYVLVAGNLETNFNRLEVFIDSEAGGVNVINGAALPRGVDSFCCGGSPPPDGGNVSNVGALQVMHGLTFDSGFNADHYITISHGFVNALDDDGPGTDITPLGFYAAAAHYADLTDGVAGRVGALGMQLAQRGLPNVLRGTTADVDVNGVVDGADLAVIMRNLGATGVNRLSGDASSNGIVGAEDVALWASKFGFNAATSSFADNHFAPHIPTVDNSDKLLGPALPALSQGELIDKVYAFGAGGAIDNAGNGAITRELQFALPLVAGTNNVAEHRNMENIVNLQMAIDNSNVAGVGTNGPYNTPTSGDPQNVRTGIEFSIPLSEIGSPAGNIGLVIFVNGAGHDYVSNQFAGTGILRGILGGDGNGGFADDLSAIKLNNIAGNQFVIVTQSGIAATVPEPASLFSAVCAFGTLVLVNSPRSRRESA